MKLGDIYVWVTNQVAGRDERRKYHVYLCEADWEADGYAFLFINKNDYGGDYAIRNGEYKFLSLPVSYVGCYIVTYTDEMLSISKPKKVGSLSKEHMIELRDTIAESYTMEQWQINLACNALKAAYDL